VTAEELDRLGTDPEPQARRIANAVAATVADDLDPGERGWVAALESLRAAMEASDEPISVALPNSRGVDKQAPLGDTCRRRSKKPRWALLLLLLARRLRPERALELGTCLGVSAGYLAGGLHLNDRGRLVTMEGARALADRSAANLAGLGLRNVEVVPGLFRTTLDEVLSRHRPVELAFVDGHHDERATLEYLDRIFPALAEPAVVVFDDIRWSEGMARAWVAIQDDPRVRVAVDLDRVGICVVGPPRPAVTARRYRLPTVTAMHARALGRSRAPPGRTAACRRRWPVRRPGSTGAAGRPRAGHSWTGQSAAACPWPIAASTTRPAATPSGGSRCPTWFRPWPSCTGC
jgi:predicted O-methyltransferase YrrM